MVLQMLPDAGQVDVHGNINRLKDVRRPNTAEHEHLRAANRARSEDNLLCDVHRLARGGSRRRELHRIHAEVVRRRVRREDEARDSAVREDVEVCARRERVDVCGARVGARPVRWVDRRRRDEAAPAVAAVGVRREGDADVLEGSRPVADDGQDASRMSEETTSTEDVAHYPGYADLYTLLSHSVLADFLPKTERMNLDVIFDDRNPTEQNCVILDASDDPADQSEA